MADKIDTVASRIKLKPRTPPYWHRDSKGCYVGFRKMASDSAGAWWARMRDEDTGKQLMNGLGTFDQFPDHQRFDKALAAAREWFTHISKGGSTGSHTIKDVCSRYVKHLKANLSEKAGADAEARFDAYVLDSPRLAGTDVTKLTPAAMEKWRDSLRDRPTKSGANRGKLRTASSLNRDMSCFRAALNLAYRDGFCTSDFAWRGKLLPIKDADRRREGYLDKAQRRKLLEKASPDLALFLRGLSLLPLRPGALADLTAGAFDKRLSVLKIGKDKAGRDRKIKLPKTTAKFFEKAAKDKLPSAPLFARADGKAWDKDAWKWPVKAAVEAAKLPDGTTAYTLRHSTISDLVHGGLDLLTVAQISGTSVRMIEQHYGHLRSDVAALALEQLSL